MITTGRVFAISALAVRRLVTYVGRSASERVPVTTGLREQLQATLAATYSIERELGGGGMSRVFVAEEKALGRRVAVKVLAPDLAAGVSAERFAREVRLAASLQHANIVPVLAAGAADGLPFYTMPLVEGQSLRARLQRDRALSVAETCSILRDVARALAYAHERGVVHRDIKPENVLISGGVGVVTDFGIAKAITAARTDGDPRSATLTQTGTSLGTPAYMAPEQAAGDPSTDHRADIYAFGVMAYEVLAGQPPFHGLPPRKLLAAHMTEQPEPIEARRVDTPPALAALVMRCLEKEPEARPQSAAELLVALDAQSSSGGAHATAPAIALASRRTLGRALLVYALAFVAIAVLARAAIVAVGLPDWVFPGALVVMALGLPVILFTALVHHGARMAHTVPRTTPGGTPAPSSTLATFAVRVRPHVTWRRATLGGIYAVAAFAVLVACFMLLRALGIGPAGSLLAAGKLKDREALLVADFRASGTDSTLGGVVAEAVRTDLAQSPVVTMVPASAIAAGLTRMRLPVTARLDPATARELAQREGIKAVVSGDVTRLGAGYLVTLRLVAAGSGDELAAFHDAADSPRELIPTIDALSRRLRGKIGESLRGVQGSPPLDRVTTSSLDALRKYVEGSRANDAGEDQQAVAALEEAVRLDTNFAMAYRKLAVALRNAGGSRERQAWAMTHAYRHRDRLTERERDLTTAEYASVITFDREQEAAAYEALLARDPNDPVATHDLGLVLTSRREFVAAESLFRRSVAVDPSPIGYDQLAITLIFEGKLDSAATALDEARRRFPGASAVSVVRAFLLYHQGHEDSARTSFERLRHDRNQSSRAAAIAGLANLAMIHGRLGEWRALRAEAHATNEARGAREDPLVALLQGARADSWFELAASDARRSLDSAMARELPPLLQPSDFPGRMVSPYLEAAQIYAIAHDSQRARASLARFDASVRDPAMRHLFEPVRHETLAEIALAERRGGDALREFQLADSLPDGPATSCSICFDAQLGRAYDLMDMPDSAITMYERYLSTLSMPHLGRDPWYLAGIYMRLGELYERKGGRERAMSYYARFIDLWKVADPALQPRVAEARRRLAELSDTERR